MRAYDTRDELRQYDARLLKFVHHGGTLPVQNNACLQDVNRGDHTAFAARLGRERRVIKIGRAHV